ncbi:MAG: cytochrome-c peroxidase [Bacteroidetes bacterium]|nr:MAG: cytochrome-c peroxidase [Bacteroidota bacterium]
MRIIYILLIPALMLLMVSSGCREDEASPFYEPSPALPVHFPSLPVPNAKPLTKARVKLGKKLFFDPILSRDSSISCASCHLPQKAFADPRQFSLGVDGQMGKRNAPALFNLAYGLSFFRDGATPTLERQVLFPIEDPSEMHNTLPVVIERLRSHPTYPGLFQQAFGTQPTVDGLTDAIAAFERTLLSYQSPYDRFLAGDSSSLDAAQQRGMQLFFGEKAECFHCHGGFNFTDEMFHNNGLYEQYADPGRWRITGKASDMGKFKTPSLRNIAYTAPYMHDGSLSSLEEVVEHYSSGGKAHPNKSVLIRRFILSEQEKQDLIAFLHALSDETFIHNPAFRPE